MLSLPLHLLHPSDFLINVSSAERRKVLQQSQVPSPGRCFKSFGGTQFARRSAGWWEGGRSQG